MTDWESACDSGNQSSGSIHPVSPCRLCAATGYRFDARAAIYQPNERRGTLARASGSTILRHQTPYEPVAQGGAAAHAGRCRHCMLGQKRSARPSPSLVTGSSSISIESSRIKGGRVLITVKEEPNLVPLCPHCDAQLDEVRARQVSAVGTKSFPFGKRYIYACPSCNRALGISHRKGFWAG
jgi:hypothetical protein